MKRKFAVLLFAFTLMAAVSVSPALAAPARSPGTAQPLPGAVEPYAGLQTPQTCPKPADLPECCPLCGSAALRRQTKRLEGGLETRPCPQNAYGEDYVFPIYADCQLFCDGCGEYQSAHWLEETGDARRICHGYQ